jgi:O-antigen ligase/tetratricopeptide (TPR) repeat protein
MLLAASWLGYFLYTEMPSLTFSVYPATVTLHIVVGAAAILYAITMIVTRRLPGGTPLDLPVVAFVAAYVLAAYTSIDWRASLEPVLLMGGALVAFYALTGLPFLSARLLRYGFMFCGLGLGLFALWVVGQDYADYLRLTSEVEGIRAGNIFPPTVPRVEGVSDHPNVLAMVLVLLLPFYALSAYKPVDAWWERALGFIGVLISGWAIFLTLSRGGWIGAIVGIAFVFIAGWATVSVYRRERDGHPVTWEAFVPAGFSPTALAAVGGALALAFFGALAFLSNSSTRPGWLFRSSLSAREDAWETGLDIFRDNILTGTGPNTFGLLYPQYSENAARFVVHTQHTHNGFLQVANDAGIVGLAALASIGVAVVYMLWRVWRKGTLEARLTAVAGSGALLGFCAHQQLDAGNIWKAPPYALAMVGAIIARAYIESTRNPVAARSNSRASLSAPSVYRYASLGARLTLPVLLVVLLFGWYRVDSAHRDFWRGLDAWNQGEASGIDDLQAAVNADSSMMVYQLQLGIAQATWFDRIGRTDQPLLQAATVHLQRAAQIDPRSELAHANLARAYQFAGRDDDAAAQAQLVRLATHHVAPVLMVGEVYEDLGRDIDAISTYGQVISMDAGLANSTFWEMTPWRREHYPEILQASTIAYNPCTYGAFLVEAVRTEATVPTTEEITAARDECRYLIFTEGLGNDLPSRVALAKMELTVGERDEARGHLDYALSRQPDYGPAHTELGLWHDDGGDINSARSSWLRGGELGEGESLRLLGDTYSPDEVPEQVVARLEELIATTGSSIQNDIVSVLYFRMRFARLSPVYALIPATWQEAVPRPFAEWNAALERWRAAQ